MEVPLSLAQAQRIVDEWIKTYGVRYYSEMTNLAILMEETGELARLFARHFGEQTFKKGHEPQNIQHEIADEMADILFVLLCLANQTNIDLQEAFLKNIQKKTNRDIIRHQNNPKLQQDGEK